jgi:hypothetical protein
VESDVAQLASSLCGIMLFRSSRQSIWLLGLAIDTKLMVDYSKTLVELHADLLDDLGNSVEDGPWNMTGMSMDCWEIFGPSSMMVQVGDGDSTKKSYLQDESTTKLQHITGIYGGTITELMRSTAPTRNEIEHGLGWQSFQDGILAVLPSNFLIQKASACLRFDPSSPYLGNGNSRTGAQKGASGFRRE